MLHKADKLRDRLLARKEEEEKKRSDKEHEEHKKEEEKQQLKKEKLEQLNKRLEEKRAKHPVTTAKSMAEEKKSATISGKDKTHIGLKKQNTVGV